MAYTRLKKLTDKTYSPTSPVSEDAIRGQIDDSIQEVLDISQQYTDDIATDLVIGQLPNDSITESKMASDMKKDISGGVASYAALLTKLTTPDGGSAGQYIQKTSSGHQYADAKDLNNGRYQSDFDFDNTVLTNITLTSNSIALSTGQTTGTAIKTVTPNDLKTWGNVKWTQTITASGSTITCDILASDGTTVLKSSVTSIADISDISITNTTIKIRWTITRLNSSDTSPTVSNPSITSEGEILTPSQVNQGTFTDTTTTIAGNGTLTKTIPLGFNAKSGSIFLQGYGSGSSTSSALIFFDTTQNNSVGISSTNGSSTTWNVSYHHPTTANLSSNLFDTTSGAYIAVQDCYISGTNLLVTFKNSNGSTATLNVPFAKWEVKG